ncbi:hypothetical protein [Vallicoccus soli]|uniref:ARB-07466-like C-terminal domain-containing protein n=1 Tax=Vallicoccus soli TaxID=2339232 RepID=A0A3A3ZHK9_9ACTN|nr:hypothetical protein [Vallicoccus soli]RJK94820.1 hypothetical protein D5H78_13480 [Vallicoccus soli]
MRTGGWAAAAALVAAALVGGAVASPGLDGLRPAPEPYPADLPAAAAAYAGPATGCDLPDPTGTGGCVTGATAWMLEQVGAAFGDLPTTCWDEHAWNPSSDHPRGRACDTTIGRLGERPGPRGVERGWRLARWLVANAEALQVRYVIWQGRIWSQRRGDDGWRPYDGGGVYDPGDPTGGHFDHVHVSLTA